MRPVDADRTSWDLFCRVVDNYGDIGIAWRLARQLAAGPERAIRLVVDGLDAFARIEPRVRVDAATQTVDGIAIVSWSVLGSGDLVVADVVVELLGCGLPDAYLSAVAARASPSVRLDFEHLSAEPWVADFHGLPSPHPTLPLVKHFFYPGFGPRTGGLLVEPDHERRRSAFLASPESIARAWRRVGLAPPRDGEARALVFAYVDSPIDALVETLAADPSRRWRVLVPEGMSTPRVGHESPVVSIPFVDQDAFDELLWACDIAFVRGEDSFVRAQLAGHPFVWQPYRQADAVHLTKLHAFEALYEVGLSDAARDAQRALSMAWNDGSDVAPATRAWLSALPELQAHAAAWRRRLTAEEPLVDRLLAFVAERRPVAGAVEDLLD